MLLATSGPELKYSYLHLLKHLTSKQDININVVLLNHGTLEQKLLNNGINVIVLDESKLNGFQILLQLISTIRKIKPDVIHTHRVKENILGSISALVQQYTYTKNCTWRAGT